MKRRLLSLFVAFAMTMSMVVVGAGAVEPTYGDTAGHWAESAIERWSGHGIIQGSNGEFDPNGPLTCAQLATILAKLLKLPAATDAGFNDNAASVWYYDAINRCAAAGILNGNGDGTVDPSGAISRERAMVILGRALGIQPIEKPDLTKFSDAAKVASYAQGMVAALIEKGIVGGVTSDTLAPQDDINRASTVTILDRAIGSYADKAGETVKVDGKGIVLVVADDVTITGDVEQLIVPADNIEVTIRGCKDIDSITVTGENSKVILDNTTANDVTLDSKNTEIETKGNSKVDTVNVSEGAAGATVNAGSGTSIGSVENKAEDTTVTGNGTVKEVASDKDMTVETKNTEVKNTGDEKITVTDKNGKTTETAAGGSSTTTGDSTGGTTGGSSGGGSSHSHTFADEWTSDDTYHWHAATCGHSEVSGKAEHTEVIDDAVAATCTETGLTEGKHCSVCSKVLTPQVETPKKDHEFNNNLKCETCGEYKETVVATIGEKGYESLIAAYNALPRNTDKNAPTTTITLIKDCAGGGFGSDADVGMKYIIDFADHTYTVGEPAVGSQGTVTQGVRVQKGSTAEFKNGTLKAANYDKLKQVVHTYGTVTFTDFTVDATKDSYAAIAVEADCGKLNINGSSSILAYDGQIGLYVAFWPRGNYPDGTTATINTTGKITGKLVYEWDDVAETDRQQEENRAVLNIQKGIFETGAFTTLFTNNLPSDKKVAKISISGGTFNAKPDDNYIAAGYEAKDNGNGTWTVVEKADAGFVAQAGGVKYATLTAAIDAAQSGDTVTLLDSVNLDADVAVDKSFTLDMNGKTVETNGHQFTVSGNLTVTGNGTVNNSVYAYKDSQGKDYRTLFYVTGNLTIENGTFTTKGAQAVFANGGTATVNGGIFKNTADSVNSGLDSGAMLSAAGTNAKLTINGATVTATTESANAGVYGIYGANGATITLGEDVNVHTSLAAIGLNNTTSNPAVKITVNGGTYQSECQQLDSTRWSKFNAVCYLSGKCDITINGGTFTAGNDNMHIFSIPYAEAAVKLTIKSGTFTTNGSMFYSENGNHQNQSVTNLIAISGGKFEGTGAFAEFDANNNFEKFITGGTFSSDPSAYLAEGCGVKNENGVFTVTGPVAAIGGKNYATLMDAIDAAKNGETVTLLRDATGKGLSSADGGQNPGTRGSITIDFGGHTYTMENPAVGSRGTETQAMHWGTTLSAVTLKNGTFCVADGATEVKMAMQNYVKFTAENMTFVFSAIPVVCYGENEFDANGKWAIFNGKEVCMFNNNGSSTEMTLTDCTVTLPESSNFGGAVSGTLTLNNTNFDGYLCFNDIDGTIVVSNGSTIKGGEVKAYFDTLTVVNNNDTWTAKYRIRIATGGTSGYFYKIGQALESTLNEKLSNSALEVIESGGSKPNIDYIRSGMAEMGVVAADVLNYAHNGSGGETMFEGYPDTNSLWVAGIYNQTVQIAANSSITSIEDLRGKTVCVGEQNSAAALNAAQVLEAYGMTFKDIKPLYESSSIGAEAIANGQCDAAFVVSYAPTPALTELAKTNSFNMLSLSDEAIAYLTANYPFLVQDNLAGGTYSCVTGDTACVVVKTVLTASKDLSEDVVYEITKAMFDNQSNLANAQPKFGFLSPESAVDGSFDLHPGAKKYYKEIGVL